MGFEHELILRVLVQTLEFELFPDFLPRRRVIGNHGTSTCQILLHRLTSTGWCSNHIDRMAHIMDVPSLYYVTLFGRPLPHKDHIVCSTSMCSANVQIDGHGYETKHVDSGCTCAFISSDLEKVTNLVVAGAIPVISVIATDESSPLQLDVQTTDGRPYPRVPVKPAEARNAAIRQMRETYESAYAVLVIDGGIRMISTVVSDEELFMRISCSGWVCRLWTYQEMILAKNLFIVLADRTVDLVQAERFILRYIRNPDTGAMSESSYSSSIALKASAFLRTLRTKPLEGLDREGSSLTIDFGSV